MEKQFGKPLTLKGLENGNLDEHTIWKETQRENGRLVGRMNAESGHITSIRTPESLAKGGSIGGKTSGKIWMQNAIESGLHKEASSAGGASSTSKVYTCQHCKKEGKGPVYFRYHGDKCKLKP